MTEDEKLKLKSKLKKSAKKACGDDKECQRAYVFGTLNKIKGGKA